MENRMTTGTIPGIRLPVSRIVLGTATEPLLSGGNADRLLDSAVEKGINAFDCARSYGLAEQVLGDWMKRRGVRQQVVVLSKCGDIRNGVVKVNAAVIQDQLEQSLNALRTDTIDLYLLHRDDPETPVGEMVEALDAAKRAGKITLAGVSNWTVERIRKANRYAQEHHLSGFEVSSVNWGLARQMRDLWGGGCVTIAGPEHREDRAWYAKCGMPVIAYSSLGRGFFSGKFRSDDPKGAEETLDAYARKGYLYPENLNRLSRAESLASRSGESVPEIAMRYVFSSDMNVFAVVSTTRPERLDSSIRAAARPLSPEETAFLEDDTPSGSGKH